MPSKNFVAIPLSILIALISFTWGFAISCYKFNENLKVIQKATLRNTIWNESVPMHDRLESCDSYLALGRISFRNRNPNMIVAPIGTKPHAIGAILYAIKNPTKVELLYDNPKRSVHRTDGIGKILVCDISKLYSEN